MADLSTASRNKLPSTAFALPGQRKYPIEDKAHARAALSRASANATPSEQASIRAKVKKKYPSIGMKKAVSEGRVSKKQMDKRGYEMDSEP